MSASTGDRLTGFDVVILVVVLISIIMGVMRGFVREAVSVVFWIGGVWAAWAYGPLIEPHLGGQLADPHVRPWIGRIAVLLLVILAGVIVGLVLRFFTRSIGLGLLDRAFGAFFGLVRGIVMVGLLIIAGQLLHLNQESWWRHSVLTPYGESVAGWLRGMAGEHGETWVKSPL